MKRNFPIDYKDTGIFLRNTQKSITKEINKQLKEMYSIWLNSFENDFLSLQNIEVYNGIQYLTCFDSYVDNPIKLTTIGKEANSKDYKLKEFKKDFAEIYQHDMNYSYEYAISHPNESYARNRKNTFYLKTRKIVCGIKEANYNNFKSKDQLLEKMLLSVLNNNLNKFSKNGQYTPCDDNTNNIYAGSFNFKDLSANVFIHELNILRPTHIIFWCGKNYDNHIIRAFGNNFYKEVFSKLDINFSHKTVSDIFYLYNKDIESLFKIKNYFSDEKQPLKILYSYHPSAHIKNREKAYNNKITNFLK